MTEQIHHHRETVIWDEQPYRDVTLRDGIPIDYMVRAPGDIGLTTAIPRIIL